MADADADASSSAPRHTCVFCNAAFPDRNRLQDHFREHGSSYKKGSKLGKPKGSGPGIKCDYCTEEFVNVSRAIYHLFRWHRGLAVRHFCPWCGKQFPIKHTYNIHMKEHENKIAPDATIQCLECDGKFYSQEALQYHHNLSHEDKKRPLTLPPPSKKININSFGDVQSVYFCHLCGQEYIMKYNLERHLRNKHVDEVNLMPGDVIKCTTCEAFFYNEKAYAFHNRFHNPKDVYVTSEEMRLNVVTKVDQDFDLRRVRNLYPVQSLTNAENSLAKNISEKQAKLAASIGNTSTFSPPPSDDSESESEMTFKEELPDVQLLNESFNFSSNAYKSNPKLNNEHPANEIENNLSSNKSKDKRKIADIDIRETEISNKRSKSSTRKMTEIHLSTENSAQIEIEIDQLAKCNSTDGSDKESHDINSKLETNDGSSPIMNRTLISTDIPLKTLYSRCQVKCNFCASKLDSLSNAILHRIKQHSDINLADYCSWCGQEFLIKHLYNIHVKTHKDKVFDIASECKECAIVFFNKNALEYHQKSNHVESIYKDDIFIPRPSTKIHFNLDNVLLFYYCHLCGLEICNKKLLKEHIQKMHKDYQNNINPNSILCDICESEFNDESAFSFHNTFHKPNDLYVGARPYNGILKSSRKASIQVNRTIVKQPLIIQDLTPAPESNLAEENLKVEPKIAIDIQKLNPPKNTKFNVKMISREDLEKLKSKGFVRPVAKPKNIGKIQAKLIKDNTLNKPETSIDIPVKTQMEIPSKNKTVACHVKLERIEDKKKNASPVKRNVTRQSAKLEAEVPRTIYNRKTKPNSLK